MDEEFLRRAERAGGPYLAEFARQQNIERPDQLVDAVRSRIDMLRESMEQPGDAQTPLGALAGFPSRNAEIEHLEAALPRIREAFSA